MEKLNKVFSDNLNYFLELRKHNRSDLAKAIGVTTSTASDWCNGKKVPRADKVAAICRFLKISMNDLLVERPTEQTFEQWLWDNYGVMLRTFGNLTEADKRIVIDMVERLGRVDDE